jgi:DNA-binding CsgD family transcriptional regulator
LDRYEIIKKLIAKSITPSDAAKQLDRSIRQVKRVKIWMGLDGSFA